MSCRSAAALLVLGALSALAFVAQADTLEQIKKSGEIRLAYRTDAPPMASNDANGQAVGYSVDLCRRIATAVKDELKLANLKVTMVPVTSQDRIDAIVNNNADIECGATTITVSRRQKVDFTAMTFVTGGSLLSLAHSGIDSVANVAGKSVAVVGGTTTESALKDYLSKSLIDAKVVVVPNRDEGMKQLDSKQVDAFAGDQIVQIGFIMRAADKSAYTLTRDLFSYEPYSFMVRRNDADFRLIADRALAQIYRDGIERLYMLWFGTAGIRPSGMLQAVYTLGALPE